MSAVHYKNPVNAVRAAELAAETASALDANARRYAQRASNIREELLQGQVQRRAAWASNVGALERGTVLAMS